MRTKCAEGHLRLLRLGYEQPQRRMETAKSISQTLAASSILTKSPARGGHGRPYGKCRLRGLSECGTAASAVVRQREGSRHRSTAGGGGPTFVLLNNKKRPDYKCFFGSRPSPSPPLVYGGVGRGSNARGPSRFCPRLKQHQSKTTTRAYPNKTASLELIPNAWTTFGVG